MIRMVRNYRGAERKNRKAYTMRFDPEVMKMANIVAGMLDISRSSYIENVVSGAVDRHISRMKAKA
jgi:predicted HicB family RNase H-like nuclease